MQTFESAPSARGSKTRPRDVGEASKSSLQARKRAMDRKAQQAFRDKTKNYIAYLEQTVDACSAVNQTTMVGQLLKQNHELYEAKERLRKILNDTLFSLQLELGSFQPNDTTSDINQLSNAVSMPPPQDWASAGSASAITPVNTLGHEGYLTVTPPPALSAAETIPAEYDMTWQPPVSLYPQPQEWPVARNEGTGTSYSSHESTAPGLPSSVNQTFPHPLTSLRFNSFLSDPCRLDFWRWSNSVYAKIFVLPPRQASLAKDFRDDVIFKAIRQGWEALDMTMQQNPVVQILREYDDMISVTTDQVNRAAIAFKNAALIKYYLGRDNSILEQVPAWLRPSPVQREKRHPILVDFFPWPSLRERFVRGYGGIGEHKFSIALLIHFKFQWPFSFEDTYFYNSVLDTYKANPLFDQYYHDLNCWTMDSRFFYEFPELRNDILNPLAGTESSPADQLPRNWAPPAAAQSQSLSHQELLERVN
ncbi:hypothetical protein A1O3_00566 [Capronia epimyces CBS 606.96]|uniref:BZIP domain-containing protein n=1 Tax=Capronia epimyces CBS 606.96 TaxID=1182542 RepID=W9YRZ0_9EURO|nr:uncharacterized protein A1O3_00566 [Capronia epimyces CBS 606.96]EXJ92016.1 hypothetical protein A1O3_00566 [Capronia epimyces CBS 606.96]